MCVSRATVGRTRHLRLTAAVTRRASARGPPCVLVMAPHLSERLGPCLFTICLPWPSVLLRALLRALLCADRSPTTAWTLMARLHLYGTSMAPLYGTSPPPLRVRPRLCCCTHDSHGTETTTPTKRCETALSLPLPPGSRTVCAQRQWPRWPISSDAAPVLGCCGRTQRRSATRRPSRRLRGSTRAPNGRGSKPP